MVKNQYSVTLNLKDPATINTSHKVVQNDKDVNVLNIKILDGTSEIDYSQINSASIVLSKPDGTTVYHDGTRLVKDATGFHYTMGTNEIAYLGKVTTCIQMFGAADERLSSPKFMFDVVGDLTSAGVIESTTEFPPLQSLIAQATASILYEEYVPDKDYVPLNRVTYNGSSYLNLIACNDILPTNSTYWLCISEKGDKGDTGEQGVQGLQGLKGDKGDTGEQGVQGIQGEQGIQGITGEVPNITIGNTTTLLPGNNATVVRRAGSPDTAPIFDFGIPKGVDGTGSGDMSKVDYDSNNDGKVNAADVADTLDGLTASVEELDNAVDNSHSHTNKSVIDLLSDSVGKLQYNGATVGDVSRTEFTELQDEVETYKSDNVSQFNAINIKLTDYNSYASVADTNEIYTIVDYKRADTTLYMKSTLSGGTSPSYTTDTWDFYDVLGTTVISTKTWTITYDANGKITSKVVA